MLQSPLVREAAQVSGIFGTNPLLLHTVSEGTRVFGEVTSAAGSIATLITSASQSLFACNRGSENRFTPPGVGGEAVTFINDVSGSVHQIAGNGVDPKLVAVTSIGGKAYTIVKDEFVKIKP